MSYSKLLGSSISESTYNAFKDKALNHSIVRRVISFKDINLIDEKTIEYAGVKFVMSETAFKSLIKILGLSTGFMETISKNLGTSVSKKLLDMMKASLSTDSTKNSICLLVDKKTTQIVNFTKSAESVLSNNAFFSLFEQTMNNHKGMEIKNLGITPEGNIEIAVLNNNWEFNIGDGKLNDEYFKSGIVFINTPNSTIVNPFNERLSCTNGMVVSSDGLSLILKNSDATSVNGFFDAVRNLRGMTNFEIEFKARIIRMMDTQASYDELLSVRRAVEYHIANSADPDVRLDIENFIPTQYIHQAYMAEKHIDINAIDKKNFKKIRTMLTVWDLVNRLTDLASHPDKYSFQLSNGTSSIFQLQKMAGELSFKLQYDLECAVPQLF